MLQFESLVSKWPAPVPSSVTDWRPHGVALAFALPFLFALAALPVARADALDEVLRVAQVRIESAQASQKHVDQLADSAQQHFRDYRRVLKELEGLRLYNERLEQQIKRQQQRLVDLEQSIRDAVAVQRQVPGLGTRMVEGLARFIELDLPFHLDERYQRIELLRKNLGRDDLSEAEKFRQILEAYSIELEYGRKIDNYRAEAKIDGLVREINVLRIGRIALLYQTTDGERVGTWDALSKVWEPLSIPVWRGAVTRGLRIARKQAAIELMKVPLAKGL